MTTHRDAAFAADLYSVIAKHQGKLRREDILNGLIATQLQLMIDYWPDKPVMIYDTLIDYLLENRLAYVRQMDKDP